MIVLRSFKGWFKKAGDKKKLRFQKVGLKVKRFSDRSNFSPLKSLQKRQRKRWLGWNFVRENNSKEKLNGRLKCKSVKGLTGKLKVEKNG